MQRVQQETAFAKEIVQRMEGAADMAFAPTRPVSVMQDIVVAFAQRRTIVVVLLHRRMAIGERVPVVAAYVMGSHATSRAMQATLWPERSLLVHMEQSLLPPRVHKTSTA
jgi:hypothetical protein